MLTHCRLRSFSNGMSAFSSSSSSKSFSCAFRSFRALIGVFAGGRPRSFSSSASSEQPFVVSNCSLPLSSDTVNLAVSALEKYGFVVLKSLYAGEELESMASKFMGHTDKVLADLRDSGVEIGIGSKAGFHEVCLRSPGRYDIPSNFDEFSVSQTAPIKAIVDRVLDDIVPAFCGVVYSEPGAADQLWHADGVHLYRQQAPATLINGLIALHDISLEMGPTELVPGSHILTNHLSNHNIKNGVDIVYQSPENSPEGIGSTVAPYFEAMPAGSVVMFDDRILHRGRGNIAKASRYIGYFSYRRSWFDVNTHFESTRSLYSSFVRSQLALASAVRSEFPALGDRADKVFADGAGGSQVHQSVMDAVLNQMRRGAANIGGYYPTSELCLHTTREARKAAADFFNCDSSEITFGANMTNLAFHVARSIRKTLSPGDNIVLSSLDHDANASSWITVAEEAGCEVRWIPVKLPTCQLDLDTLQTSIDSRTKLVAVGYAANSTGTINDVRTVCQAARQAGAISFVDAVHYAPHFALDVQDVGCDFMACSPYKFFGPHCGMLFGRKELMSLLSAYRMRVQTDDLPTEDTWQISRWELGTQNYEALAGLTACVDYIASVGDRFGSVPASSTRRERIVAGWQAIQEHETALKIRFLTGISKIPGMRVFGITDLAQTEYRTSTFAVGKVDPKTNELVDPDSLTKFITSQGVFCTSGNHYCTWWEALTGLNNQDGATRISFLHYNTEEDVDKVLEVLRAA